jgi:hypothetical protein
MVATASLRALAAGLPRRSEHACVPRDHLHLTVRAGQGRSARRAHRASADAPPCAEGTATSVRGPEAHRGLAPAAHSAGRGRQPRGGLLPVVEQRAEDPEPVDGSATRGRARATLPHRRTPPSSVLSTRLLAAGNGRLAQDGTGWRMGSDLREQSLAGRRRTAQDVPARTHNPQVRGSSPEGPPASHPTIVLGRPFRHGLLDSTGSSLTRSFGPSLPGLLTSVLSCIAGQAELLGQGEHGGLVPGKLCSEAGATTSSLQLDHTATTRYTRRHERCSGAAGEQETGS